MSRRFFAMGVVAVLIALGAVAPVKVAGQSSASAAKQTSTAARAWTPPRTPDGRPDMQGVWSFATITPLERPAELAGKEVLTDEDVAALQAAAAGRRVDRAPRAGEVGAYNQFWMDGGTKVIGTRRSSLIVDPPDGKLPPYTSQGQKKLAARAVVSSRPATGPEDLELDERCIVGFNSGPPMLPGAYNNNFQMFQTRDHVVILNEMVHDARIIPMDGRPHGTLRQWGGDSRGRWEGNTLVVDTTGFMAAGTGHPATVGGKLEPIDGNLHLVERFTRVDADTLLYEFTVDDPTAWTRPWSAAFPMTKTQDLIYEYACHEGNYSMSHILEGARADEKAAEEAKKRAR